MGNMLSGSESSKKSGEQLMDTNSIQYQMWRFIVDFDHGYDMTFEQRFARENCNDRGEVLNHQFSFLVKYELVNYFAFCHQALQEKGLLPTDIGTQDEKEAEGDEQGLVSLKKKEFRLINAPFPAPPMIARMWDLWILYSREYREFCLKFYGGILLKHTDKSKESFEAYQEFRSNACIESCENLWPEYETYEDFLFEFESPVVWISLQQKNEFLKFVSEQYNKFQRGDPNREVTDFTKEICDKYLEKIQVDIKAKDEEIEEVDDNITFIELKDQIPETAKPNLKEFIHKKLEDMNKMELPEYINEHLEKKHLMSRKQSKRYVKEYKKYIMCALASKIAVTPSEQTDLVWHTHLCSNQIYPVQMAQIMFKKRGGRFDHGPTKGGNAQGILFTEQYTRTLELYEYMFGPAPEDIWEPLDKRFNPTLFCLYHVDLRRLSNYQLSIEITKDSQNMKTFDCYDQSDSIVALGEPHQSGKDFFQHQTEIQNEYVENCKKFGSSYVFGGKCIVQNMHQAHYYTQPHFFQMIESNTKLGEAHPSIKKGDILEGKKLVARTKIEVHESNRRQVESEVFERKYAAKFKPNEGAACFSYSFFYRRLEIKQTPLVS